MSDAAPAPSPDDFPALELAILSRRGGRERNEDACGHWHSDAQLCCVVADGAGGHGAGDVAARLAVRHVIGHCAARPPADADAVHALLRDTGEAVVRHRADDPRQAHMHTTVVALFIDLARGEALWGHAGDSRLYLFRGGRIVARTRDHSTVQSLLEAGALKPAQVQGHPRRSELLSALGSPPELLRLDAAARPWPLHAGDVFLLCTDGLWDYVDDDELCAGLQTATHPRAWLAWLEKRVLRNAARRGAAGHDNFSGVSVWVHAPGDAPQPTFSKHP